MIEDVEQFLNDKLDEKNEEEEMFDKNKDNPLPVIQELEKEHEKMSPDGDDFIVRTYDEIIPVPNCTYVNENKRDSKFFLCTCSVSSQGFEPICEACAMTCHKNHHPTLEIKNASVCMCGSNNHRVSEEMEKVAKSKLNSASTSNLCFYSKFFDITPNRGYFRFHGKIYCAVCVENCLNLKFDDISLSKCEQGKNVCQCSQQHEINVIKLNADFISRKDFNKHIRNFNFNILFKIPKSKQIYIDVLANQIASYVSKKTKETATEFFKNFIIVKILELFSAFSVYWENKFFYIVPTLLGSFKMKDLFELMSIQDIWETIDKESAQTMASAKFCFAELIFNYIARTYMLKYNNLWNIRTILNMNLYQRFIYIKNIKKFHLFLKEEYTENCLEDLANNILDLYDKILAINQRYDISEKIISYVFPTFNRIMKYMIKNNLLNEEDKSRYFDLVLSTIKIQNERQTCSLKRSCYYILKSILYELIYLNDVSCIHYLNHNKKERKKFVFQRRDDVETISKIFFCIVKDFDRKENISRTVIFDFYVRKFFELMTDKEDFCINSIKNLDEEEIRLITSFEEDNDTFFENIKSSLNPDFYGFIQMFVSELNNYNRQYFIYEVPQEIYCKNVTDILTKFKMFMTNIRINFDEIENKYAVFREVNQSSYENLNQLKQCIMYSLFFQKIEEFIHIYAQGKIFPQAREGFEYSQDDLTENIQFLLKFLFAIVNHDPRFLCLVMNIKPQIFVATFYDTRDTLIQFLERISEIVYSNIPNEKLTLSNAISDEVIDNSYKYDNLYFISECVTELIIHCGDNLSALADVMNMSIKSLRNISLHKSDFLNAVEQFSKTFRELSQKEEIVNRMKAYINELIHGKPPKENNDEKEGKEGEEEEEEEEIDKEIIAFVPAYYNFLSEMKNNDIDFFNYMEDVDILPKDEFIALFIQLLRNNFQNVPVETEYALTRYYISLHHPFQISLNKIEEQIKNLLMDDIDDNLRISMIHLSKRLLVDSATNKKEELIKVIKVFKDILTEFSIDKFESKETIFKFQFYENIILRPMFIISNFFILHSNDLEGVDGITYRDILLLFLKDTVILYKDNSRLKDSSEEEKLKFLYEEISVKIELTKSVLEDIYNDAVQISDNSIAFFEIRKMFRMFHTNIERLIEYERGESSMLDLTRMSVMTTNTILPKTPEHKRMMLKQKLVDKYMKCKEKTYDTNLSLINGLGQLMKDTDKNYNVDMIMYFQEKLFDSLTDMNIRFLTDYEPVEMNQNVNEFKIQNVYVLHYLNNLFYHDSDHFQDAFSSEKSRISNLFYVITQKFIVPGTISEVIKLYSIDEVKKTFDNQRVIGRKETLPFMMSKLAIKFCQNLCDGHNRQFQDIFFNLKLEKGTYIDKNKNIYQDTKPKLTNYQVTMSGAFGITSLLSSVDNNDPDEETVSEIEGMIEMKLSFFNLMCSMMRIINDNLPMTNSFKSQQLIYVMKFKSHDNIMELYTRYNDLVIEMIQGASVEHFKFFYMSDIPEGYNLFLEDQKFVEESKENVFVFLLLGHDIQRSLFDPEQTFNHISIDVKCSLFTIINNVLSQENINYSIIKAFQFLFPSDELINLISKYLRGIYIRYIGKIHYDDQGFQDAFKYLELGSSHLTELKDAFKHNTHIFVDEFFKLASQMFLFITIMAKKYQVTKSIEILDYIKKDAMMKKSNLQIKLAGMFFFSLDVNTKPGQITRTSPKDHNYMNDNIISCLFFNKVIKQCEFKIDTSYGQFDLKTIYFITDPHYYYVSKTNIDNFFQDVDVSSSTKKLSGLMDGLNLFMKEVEYKSQTVKKMKFIQALFTIDFKRVDYYNFCFSIFMNILLLLFYDDTDENTILSYTIKFLVGIQSLINVIYLILFVLSKYKFYVMLSMNEKGKKKLSIFEYIRIYLLDSFFFNDEIYLLIFTIVTGTLGIFSRYSLLFFALQLFTAIKFVDSLRDFMVTIKLRYRMILMMIEALGILMLFFSSIGYYFFPDEFDTIIEGKRENYCRSLLECFILYLNKGLVSGIGSIMGAKSFDDMTSYTLRLFNDIAFYLVINCIFVNMFIAVVVSAFMKLREDTIAKLDDIQNKCFICNIKRIQFEKRQIDFAAHRKIEHNLKNYIKFFIFVKRIPEKDLDADQSFIVSCLKKRSVKFFPVNFLNGVLCLDEEEED